MSQKCECQKEQNHGRCCCTCAHRLDDYYHCTTIDRDRRKYIDAETNKPVEGCVCGIKKGFICFAPEFGQYFSDWSEHGLCEMHFTRPEVRDEQ